MDRILDRLWCGNFEDGLSLSIDSSYPEKALQQRYILNISQYAHDPYPEGLHTKVLHEPIQDEVFLPAETWDTLVTFLAQMLTDWHTVLVHCRLGKSRAPSLCAAYLIRCGFDPDTALRFVKGKRPGAHPHPETWRSVVAWSRGA